MKTNFSFLSLILCACALFLVNCSGNNKEGGVVEQPVESANDKTEDVQDVTASTAGAPQFKAGEVFQGQLTGVFDSYVTLKEAFVSSDASKVKKEAKQTEEAIAKVDMKLLEGAAHNDWMNYLNGMQSSLKEIQSSDDIEAQRTSFSKLSDNLYKSIKAYGLGGKTAYYEFCPMAFNNQGGFWLSDDKKIRNPYFGDKMLTCGEVKETL
jgi:hypothetical protein